MTEQELMAIETRANAATAGPWVGHITQGCYDQLKVVFYRPSRKAGHVLDKPVPIAACKVVYGDIDREMAQDNMAFIAHARQDIPALLTEVRRLQALVDALAPSE